MVLSHKKTKIGAISAHQKKEQIRAISIEKPQNMEPFAPHLETPE
jgi:hypothetical protein